MSAFAEVPIDQLANGDSPPPSVTSAAQSSPSRSNSARSLYNLLTMSSPSEVTRHYAAAAVDRATHLLPTSLSSLASRRRPSSPPPLLIAIRLQNEPEDAYLPLSPSTSLSQLLERCAAETNVPLSSLKIFVEEVRPASASQTGLLSSLRASASSLTSRERVRETLVDWVNFIFLPEAVNREVRGRGVMSWLRSNVLPHLEEPPPPHIAQATAILHGGRRWRLELSATATLTRLHEEIERQTGVPSDRQQIVVIEQPQLSATQKLFWAIVKLIYVILCAIAGVVGSWMRWIALGPLPGDEKIVLKLESVGGSGDGSMSSEKKVIELKVRKDMTLAELQNLVKLQHGDSIDLERIILTAAVEEAESSGSGAVAVDHHNGKKLH